jgi:hypothetical protein
VGIVALYIILKRMMDIVRDLMSLLERVKNSFGGHRIVLVSLMKEGHYLGRCRNQAPSEF